MTGFRPGELRERLASWVPRLLEDDALVTAVARIPGGASRHTWRAEVSAGGRVRSLIFRFDPEVSLLESNRAVEVGCYRAMADVAAVPVPAVLHDEDDPAWIGMPFFVMEAVEGDSNGGRLAALPPDQRRCLAEEFARVLAAIAACDWSGLAGLLPEVAPESAWSTELARWEAVLDAHELSPMPITRAAIRWLRRNPPPPPERVSLVHGDCRAGNFLQDGEHITAVLDWEMAHLGDPVEDLTWGWLRNWRYDMASPELVGGLCTRDDAIAMWSNATGLTPDPHALVWWELLGNVKAVAIWTTGGRQFADGATGDVLLGLIPWLYTDKQEEWMLDLLDEARAT